MLKGVPVVLQSVPAAAAPKQKPSVATKPVRCWPNSMLCSVAAVTQTPVAQSAPPVHCDPGAPPPATGAHAARHDEPLWTGCGSQPRPRPLPSAAQSASLRQVGSHEATRFDA